MDQTIETEGTDQTAESYKKAQELYSLQEHYISHYIRDYYVQVDGRDGKELEVTGIYTPVLENGERTAE